MASPYDYCGNSPMVHVDPDGEFFWLAAAIFAGFSNMAFNYDKDTSFGDGLKYFAVGAAASVAGGLAGQAVSGALNGAFGFARGAMTGAAGGVVSGFASGAGNAWVGGADFGTGLASGLKSGGMGGLTGGAISGLVSGLNATAFGGKFWSGVGTTNYVYAPPSAGTSRSVGENMDFSNNYAQEFIDDYLGEVRGMDNLYSDGTIPPGSFARKGDVVLARQGYKWREVAGVTVNNGINKGSDVYLFKAAFRSKDYLYLTIGHEFVHVGQNLKGLRGHNAKEASAYRWTYKQAEAWGLNMYSKQNASYSRYHNPAYDTGPAIRATRPWLVK